MKKAMLPGIMMADKLSAWMTAEGVEIEDVRRALVELEEARGVVDISKLMDLVRRDQLGRVYEEITCEGLVFPEASRLYSFTNWYGRVEMREMREAIVRRDWDMAKAAGESMGMSDEVVADAYDCVSTGNIFWTMKRAGREKYMSFTGEQKTIDRKEKPDWRLQESIEKFLPECMVAPKPADMVVLDDLWMGIVDDQMSRISKYTHDCLEAAQGDSYPDDLEYPEGSRLREFAKTVVFRERVLRKIEGDSRYVGFRLATCRLHLSLRLRDESGFREMCEFFGIPEKVRDETFWMVRAEEIMWVLWETEHAKFVRKDGTRGDAHNVKKVKPPDDVRKSIEKCLCGDRRE